MRSRRRPAPAPTLAALARGEVRLSEACAVAATAEGLHAARRFVRSRLSAWEIPTAVANATLDVAHELVSNAVQHAKPPISLELQLATTSVVILVRDESRDGVRRLPYRPGVSEHGLGMRLVSQLSTTWGQELDASGKTVWALLTLPSPR